MLHKLEMELKKLKQEMVEMKTDMNLRLEDQFIKIKGQMSEIMDELSKQGEDINNIKTLIATRESSSSENTPKEDLKSLQENSHNNKNECNCKSETKSQTSLPQMEKELRQLSFKLCEQEKCINNLKLEYSTEFVEEMISKMHSRHSVLNKNTQVQLKKLEELFNSNLKNGKKAFYKALKSIKEKIDKNRLDIDELWIKMNDIDNKEGLIVLDGETLRIDNELGKLKFGLEALWLQSDELKDDVEKLNLKFVPEQDPWHHLELPPDGIWTKEMFLDALKKTRLKLGCLDACVGNLQGLYLDSVANKSENPANDLAANCLEYFQDNWPIRSRDLIHYHEEDETNESNVAASEAYPSETNQSTCGNMVGRVSFSVSLEDKSFEELRYEFFLSIYRIFPIIKSKAMTVSFKSPQGKDTAMMAGAIMSYSTSHQCVTAMAEYEQFSLEELRWTDYEELDSKVRKNPFDMDNQFSKVKQNPFDKDNQFSKVKKN
ncbi:uncharacterized protein LOC131946046 [Physella acuta]|uniref:uncharacterized protein LOC131946046 n=1 Tax=Physella acuta TaxID=109671 RepID=UPI0027DCE3D3|nr:uncharacterized protein LOC131946046 [Physella acuta]